MRIALCIRRQGQLFRLVWLNESKAGIYLGVLGAQEDSHVSYHQDGTRHMKIGADYHNRFSDVPISSHKGFKQLDHFSLSLTKNWFNSKTAYKGDEKTESLVLLDERLLYEKDTLALDVWLLDRASEQDALTRDLIIDPTFNIVGELVSALDCFPGHKIVITLCSARIREVPSDLLLQAPEVKT